MLTQNEGVIVFLSSDAGLQGSAGSSAYCASKWGVFGFAGSIAKELKNTRIRITTIAPGRIWTPMAEESEAAGLGLKWLDPAHVSRAVLFCIRQDPDVILPRLQIQPVSGNCPPATAGGARQDRPALPARSSMACSSTLPPASTSSGAAFSASL